MKKFLIETLVLICIMMYLSTLGFVDTNFWYGYWLNFVFMFYYKIDNKLL